MKTGAEIILEHWPTPEQIISALDRAGFVIVPREPTLEMSMAGNDLMVKSCGLESPSGYYRAMIEAAPK